MADYGMSVLAGIRIPVWKYAIGCPAGKELPETLTKPPPPAPSGGRVGSSPPGRQGGALYPAGGWFCLREQTNSPCRRGDLPVAR
ncbi:hypothetical protein D0T84_17030 [Dysgonomonas sp. 521]|nr:hypothetical protein [Dysgonomonas sp. 521]